MSAAVRCRECGERLMVREGRGRRAHVRNGAVIRAKWCVNCGHEEYTVEIAVRDLPAYLYHLSSTGERAA